MPPRRSRSWTRAVWCRLKSAVHLDRWALLVLALAAGPGICAGVRSKNYLQKQADQKVIKETGQQLADLTKRKQQTRPPALETTEKAMEAVNELGDQFTRRLSRASEALKGIWICDRPAHRTS